MNESQNPVKDGTLFVWDMSAIPNGTITLRLTLVGERTEVDERVHLTLSLPTPTVPSATPTVTPFPTDTPTAIPPTDIPTDTPTLTPFPTDAPTETETPAPTP